MDARRTPIAAPGTRGEAAESATAPVFISYSRRDYYFAESLAYELEQRGVRVWLDVTDLVPGGDWHEQIESAVDASACVVVVASRDSVESPHVGSEWGRALRQGTRVVIARWRGEELPVRLAEFETVDFRGRFAPALDELAARLRTDPEPPRTASEHRRRARVPPWIAVLAVELGAVSLVPFLLANYDESSSLAYEIAATTVAWALVFWFFVIAFVRRRVSMLRLALTFAYVAGTLGYLLLQLYASAPEFFGGATVRTARAAPWLPASALAGALIGLATVLLVRPSDLLRWTPTGAAWDVYRPPLAAERGPASPDTPLAFRLVHDAADAPAAERLRDDLIRSGGVEESDGATAVLLLTNRTRPEWLDDQTRLREGDLLTVVGTGVRTLPALEWLWRRQVSDFRRWTAEQSLHTLVPETFARRRPPLEVRLAHGVLCAFAALVFSAGGTAADAEGASVYAVAVGYTAAVLGAACALAAHLLIRRSPSLAFVLRAMPALGLAAIGGGFLALQQVDAAAARLVVPAAFLVAAPIWLRIRAGSLRFWIPVVESLRLRSRNAERRVTLEPGKSWSTLLWFFGFAVAWMAVLGAG